MSDVYARPSRDDQPTVPDFAPAAETDDAVTIPPAPVQDQRPWGRDLRFMLVVLVAVVVLFIAFVFVVAFGPTAGAVSALAIVAAPIATMVAAYYGISLALRQVRDARDAAVAADARAHAAETSARESDAWAAQMESGLRVSVAKLRAAGVDTRDVERAAGTPDEFF
ncbi:hypothetical protein MUN74_18455 [Agromyces endophyticus]|uniref:hypothetical protein n=1 Tax=Agromyces sp. H17E-10 TaxID=2932244 RepID=UPI001FD02ABE|nr:hypothetical protein [Agromyces sp. H17E-10]UOQ89212.1 hypothetical protein MUN74_18455 [Agromyces sp. H17E-10]